MHRRSAVVAAIGTAQTLAWGSSYYLPAILAAPIGASLGLSRSWVFAAFSASLLMSALAGPAVGRAVDRRGGRGVLVVSSLVLAAGLATLAMATGPVGLFAAWLIIGVGMALGLYDAAFAALTALYGREARTPITGITLMAGFASTVSWPLTAALEHAIGWRGACLVWAGLNLAIALPLYRFLIPGTQPRSDTHVHVDAPVGWTPRREMLVLAFVFAAAWYVAGAMGAHLPGVLERAGATPLQAVAAAALLGPAQVAARVAEFLVLRRAHPLLPARVALLLHPAGAVALGVFGPAAAAVFVVLHGAGNGLVTIARGTLPLALMGPRGYGARTGLLAAPARIAQAFAPLTFGALLDVLGASAIVASAALCLSGCLALFLLRHDPGGPP